MKERKLYMCEICGTEYAERFAAEQCEKNHKKAKKIRNCRYLSRKQNETGIPVAVEVEMSDGSVFWFKR